MNIRKQNKAIVDAFHAAGCTGKGIVFALIDTGVVNLKKFNGRIINPPGVQFGDYAPHGTYMASRLLNACPDAWIINYPALGSVNSLQNILNALNGVLKTKQEQPENFYIVNMSLSGEYTVKNDSIELFEQTIDKLVAAGIPCFVAAGNDGKNNLQRYPSCFESPICVSAVDENGNRADFSTWHNEVDFCDLGVNESALNRDGLEEYVSGTSIACPNVAWKAALKAELYKRENGKWPTETWIYEALKADVYDMGEKGLDPYFGWGYADIKLTAAKPVTPPSDPVEPPVTPSKPTLKLTDPYMRGDDVEHAQRRLVAHGYSLIVDGIFGRKTDETIRAFQTAKGLSVDGIIGKKTWAALDAEPSEKPVEPTPEPPTGHAEGLVQHCYEALGDIYVWGGNGQTAISESWIKRMDMSDAQAARSIAFWKKQLAAGMTDISAYDCSGLISKYLMEQGIISRKKDCDGLWTMCTRIQRNELRRGDLLFRHSNEDEFHVGVYVGRGRVVEAKGRDDGVIIRPIDAQKGYWTKYGRLKVLEGK